MADFFTYFSCVLDIDTSANAAPVVDQRGAQ